MTQKDKFDDNDARNDVDQPFGGKWTLEKLDMLERYLDAYTTALKKSSFNLIYIDGFAGTGDLKLKHDPVMEYVEGSAKRAVRITNNQFNELFFVEKNPDRYEKLKQNLQDKRCQVVNDDFNIFIKDLKRDWESTRGVLFLDPFGATVDWTTMEHIAGLNALDMWILYPTSAILRILPREKHPETQPGWPKKLDKIFGGNGWRALYRKDPQQKLFGEPDLVREPANVISEVYKEKLRGLFKKRFLDETYLFKYNNNVLFEFMFCVGHPRGIPVAKNIAKYIVTKSQSK